MFCAISLVKRSVSPKLNIFINHTFPGSVYAVSLPHMILEHRLPWRTHNELHLHRWLFPTKLSYYSYWLLHYVTKLDFITTFKVCSANLAVALNIRHISSTFNTVYCHSLYGIIICLHNEPVSAASLPCHDGSQEWALSHILSVIKFLRWYNDNSGMGICNYIGYCYVV